MAQRWSGQRLVDLRGRKTQTDLANALRERGFGTTQTTISRWESGKVPRGYVLPALAAELGCSVDELFVEDEAEAATMGPLAAVHKADILDALLDALHEREKERQGVV